jgi:hypothetical protein
MLSLAPKAFEALQDGGSDSDAGELLINARVEILCCAWFKNSVIILNGSQALSANKD